MNPALNTLLLRVKKRSEDQLAPLYFYLAPQKGQYLPKNPSGGTNFSDRMNFPFLRSLQVASPQVKFSQLQMWRSIEEFSTNRRPLAEKTPRSKPYGSKSCAICTALRAAPLRIWSATTHSAKPCSTVGSFLMRPT